MPRVIICDAIFNQHKAAKELVNHILFSFDPFHTSLSSSLLRHWQFDSQLVQNAQGEKEEILRGEYYALFTVNQIVKIEGKKGECAFYLDDGSLFRAEASICHLINILAKHQFEAKGENVLINLLLYEQNTEADACKVVGDQQKSALHSQKTKYITNHNF